MQTDKKVSKDKILNNDKHTRDPIEHIKEKFDV